MSHEADSLQFPEHQNTPDLMHGSDDVPQVTFDIALGQQLSHIDFDYEKYRRLIQHEGGSAEDFSDAKIRIRPANFLTHGSYTPSDGTVTVRTDRQINKALVHESRHYIDHRQGADNEAMTIASNVSMLGGAALTAANVAYKAMPEHFPEALQQVQERGPTAALGIFALSAVLYYGNPDERRARKAAERHQSSDVISVSKK